MTVRSIFEFTFPIEQVDEGYMLSRNIGADMRPLAGYLDHEVVRDVKDPSHIMVSTLWENAEAAWAVLNAYQHDDKIKRTRELMGKAASGFVGEVGR